MLRIIKLNDYIEFAAYFATLKASFYLFILIVNNDVDYKGWLEVKHDFDIDYNYNELELFQKIY